jgi:hypothetical protein
MRDVLFSSEQEVSVTGYKGRPLRDVKPENMEIIGVRTLKLSACVPKSGQFFSFFRRGETGWTWYVGH